jgi:hypothetical protein
MNIYYDCACHRKVNENNGKGRLQAEVIELLERLREKEEANNKDCNPKRAREKEKRQFDG